ncbi:BRCT domain-containing protein [Corynebacterium heidelbergense]|uniref:BRCT domain-containing protein n=1 Tax=Corynebacterium heidelbergense TaxID=2055947 RepID=UPI001EE779AD|nr:BRCT domain-containing protein [Corynebacterium heidelbergense]
MQEDYGFDHLIELCPPSGTRRRRKSVAEVNQAVVQDRLARVGNSTVLKGERVTITGTLQRGQRAEVQQLVEALGGAVEKNLTKKTTILVV